MLEEDSSERDMAWSCCFRGPWNGKQPSLLPGYKIGSSRGHQRSQKRDEDGVWLSWCVSNFSGLHSGHCKL